MNIQEVPLQTSTIPFDEAKKQFPFLRLLDNGNSEREYMGDPKVILTPLSDALLRWKLVEDESEAMGHANIHQDVFLIKNGVLEQQSIRRTTTQIYPPEYLHPFSEYPEDVIGESEMLGEALLAINLDDVPYILVHSYGGRDYYDFGFYGNADLNSRVKVDHQVNYVTVIDTMNWREILGKFTANNPE